jgi:rubrerythrin
MREDPSRLDMVYTDPYEPDRGYYECPSCGTRTTSDAPIASCPDDCGGSVRNLAVPRE